MPTMLRAPVIRSASATALSTATSSFLGEHATRASMTGLASAAHSSPTRSHDGVVLVPVMLSLVTADAGLDGQLGVPDEGIALLAGDS